MGDEGRGKAAISCGKEQTSCDPQISEWGNPAGAIQSPSTEYIGREEQTQGSEPSQYLQEKKVKTIASVAASERARA